MFIQGAGPPQQLSVIGNDGALTWDGTICKLTYGVPAVGGLEEIIFVPGHYHLNPPGAPLNTVQNAPLAEPAEGPNPPTNVQIGNDGQLTPLSGG